ncbi:MAG: M15 family metallopeptidase [Spirochaetales bacterium]|nr:M15 family metallopeptidase [Spirochaetales bacterium]
MSGYRVLGILTEAYPDVVTDRLLLKGDWSVLVGGERIFWAGGRLLPEEDRDRADDFSPHPFYYYSDEYEPHLPDYTKAEKERIIGTLEGRDRNPPVRNPRFFDLLYRIHDEESAWDMMTRVNFLGFKMTVHRDMTDKLARIDGALRKLMESDGPLRDYVASLESGSGYSWREIARTGSRSNHSYGIALDFTPRDYGGKDAYWLWSRDFNREWFTLGWSRRYRPPESFVRAFEAEGFVWGGKWFLFDSIHFEYRPEILLLNRSGHGL